MAREQTGPISEAVIEKVQTGSMQMNENDAITLAGEFYKRGQFLQASNVCRQIINHRPTMADAHNILGVALAAMGQRKDAVASLRRAIKLAPRVAAYHANLGEVQRNTGHLADARLTLLEAVKLDPANAHAHNNLGIVEFERKDYPAAVAAYRQALACNPSFPEAWNNLGNAVRLTGDTDEAMRAYEKALGLRESYPEAYNNLGSLLNDLRKSEQAEHAFRKALMQNPGYIDAYNNLGALYFAQDQAVEALRQMSEVLKLAPRNARALLLTARIQLRRGSHDPAEQACRIVLADDAGNVEAMTILGQVLYETDKHDEALAVLEKAVALGPDQPEARNFYGVVLKAQGRLEDARTQILEGLRLHDTMYGAYANLSDLVDYGKEPELFDRVETIMESVANPTAEIMLPMHYAYAKALDDVGRHHEALDHYITGGRMKRAQLRYDEAENAAFFASIKAAFPAEVFAERRWAGNPSAKPLFIVGMPRSGSTLVEQIIASHPDVHGAGEVKHLSQALHILRDRFPSLSRYPDMVGEMSAGQFELVANQYLREITAASGDAARITDKLPTNYFFIGIIHLLFPNAKIINTLRDPVDTCLSTFTKLFKDDVPHSYDLAEIGRYYRLYEDLMAHWEAVLPPGVLTSVAYEDVINDNEATVRRLIDFVGLEWNEACLNFHESKRPVKTASVAQVRKPLYKTALQRWRKYGPGLQPLVDALGLDHDLAAAPAPEA